MSFTQSETLEAIRSIEVISGHPRVALRLIELSRKPEVEVAEYAQLIETDPGLSGRLLGLVNSACYAPAERVLTVARALPTLGMRQVRVIALSHCVASLHQALAIEDEKARSLWAASMSKAIAARKVADFLGLEDTEAAFTAGLMQDLGLALMHSMDSDALFEIHGEIDWSLERMLQAEVAHFGLDHCAVGRRIAERLDLPAVYRLAIERHHAPADETLLQAQGLDLAVCVAGFLPHDGANWTSRDLGSLASILEERLPKWPSMEAFLSEIEEELAGIDQQLGTNIAETPDLVSGLIYASQENARESMKTMANNIWLRDNSSTLNERLHDAKRAHKEAERRADRDPLTQLFNRHGWDRRARLTLSRAGATEGTLGLAFFDLDHFKELNDSLGHAAGDEILRQVSLRMTEAVREDDLICRWGGDEFVILFSDASANECLEAARRVKQHVQSVPIVIEGQRMKLSVTVGFVSIDTADSDDMNLGDLLEMADAQLYRAKSLQRGTLSSTEAD
jgi:diguanylate cyclase (GGDEF)-like protein